MEEIKTQIAYLEQSKAYPEITSPTSAMPCDPYDRQYYRTRLDADSERLFDEDNIEVDVIHRDWDTECAVTHFFRIRRALANRTHSVATQFTATAPGMVHEALQLSANACSDCRR